MGRGRLLEHSISLMHTPPTVPYGVTLEVNNHDESSDFLEEQPAALLKVLNREALKQLASSMMTGDDPT